ncbi:MAG: thiamine pyrophosphate-dependent enzyme [Planctomycetota bacterium]
MSPNQKGVRSGRQHLGLDGVRIGRDAVVPDYLAPADLGGEDKPHGLHPYDAHLRPGRLPHIWCEGCGLGTALTAFIDGVGHSGVAWERLAVVSGIGCTGRVAGYLKLDGYHTTHGRAIPFATGLALAQPELKVVVFSGDGDLFAIGGNHFIHAARRNVDMTVVCVNNLNYAMTGGQMGPTTPLESWTTTTPQGNAEHPFNLVHLAAAAGAVYVARWTTLHVRRLAKAVSEALDHRGFSFVEVISPCPTCYGRRNDNPRGIDSLQEYRDHAVVRHGADPAEASIGRDGRFIVGKLVDTHKPTFSEMYRARTAPEGKTG